MGQMKLFVSAVMFVALCGSGSAHAQDSDARARDLFVEGSRLYDVGKYEEAVAAFDLAYELSQRPQLLYNLASALERLGRWDEALGALERYRDQADIPANELVALTVRIDQLSARIAERDNHVVVPLLQPVSHGPSPLGVGLVAGGAAFVGVGSVFGGRALGARSQWSALCDQGDVRLCPQEAQDLWRRDNTSSAVADVSLLVGLAAAGSGAAVLLGGQSAFDISVSGRGAGVVVSGVFP